MLSLASSFTALASCGWMFVGGTLAWLRALITPTLEDTNPSEVLNLLQSSHWCTLEDLELLMLKEM